jgi:hypothetical protein
MQDTFNCLLSTGGVRFGGQGGSLAQTIRPARQIAAGGSDLLPDLELPQGEPVSPPSSGNGGDNEEWGSQEERQEGLDQHSATGTEFFAGIG